MPAGLSQATPIDQMRHIVIEQVKKTNDVTLLDLISQLLTFEGGF